MGRATLTPHSVIPRLGLGIHEFSGKSAVPPDENSWMARPSLAMTMERASVVSSESALEA
jgi:hypothetical protein